MAEPLKNHFGPNVVHTIASMIAAVEPAFPSEQFVADALEGYEPLGLTERGRKIAGALRAHLPDNYREAIKILLASLGKKPVATGGDGGMASFLYLPHTLFVAAYGLDDFEPSMRAQYELTKRFTAEFSIRAFLERYPEATLARLAEWARDPSEDVRRLVSEGTRPRLPWAGRLRAFQRDPRPVLALLEILKDDPSLYVRRSVANNLNDIGKDHPDVLAKTARRWLKGATPERRWLVTHALRSAVKRGEAGALNALGFGGAPRVGVRAVRIAPARVRIGGSIEIAFEIVNTAARRQRVLVDLCIHFVKASGRTNPKVFKLKSVDLGPRERVPCSKRVSLAELTTRKHYPGTHRVGVILNGAPRVIGKFQLLRSIPK
ncbi:MAG: DNA alkylation repair protein [bacterium]